MRDDQPRAIAVDAPASVSSSIAPRRSFAASFGRRLVGDRPRVLLALAAPTGLAVLLDVVLRARALLGFAPQGKLIYASSILVSAAFWSLPLFVAARVRRAVDARRGRRARVVFAVLLVIALLPIVTMSYPGQVLYHRVFHSYMGRDTLRLGIALRGTVAEWLAAWGGWWLWLGVVAIGIAISVAMGRLVGEIAKRPLGRTPIVLVVTFVGALVCFWTDNVDSRFLQAATPDACLVHGVVHLAKMALTGQWRRRQGMTVRTPDPLPPLVSTRADRGGRDARPNVIVILTESVRADAICSAPPPACAEPSLDDVAADRIPLGVLATPTPNTFSAFMIFTTGLSANVDFETAHRAPVLWELARAVGYRTFYVASQNPHYEDFGAFVQRAGIDVLAMASDLGGMRQEQLGAPDERASERLLAALDASPPGSPWFAVLHLANTHAPYRVDPELQPFAPHSTDPLGDIGAYFAHYRNSVRLQTRTVAAFLRRLRAMPRWNDTVVIFLSDHGEQFREHGGLYHNHSLFDEELRVPGFLVAGANALDDWELAALRSIGARRTFTQDVHETIVDLLGLETARGTLPYASLVEGRSMLRPLRAIDPPVLLSTSTGVWEPDDARFGAMTDDRVLMGAPPAAWTCFDLRSDPFERAPLPSFVCAGLEARVRSAFPR